MEVLRHWPLTRATASPLVGGLINTTYKVDADEGEFVLQALHPIFGADVHYDIEAITQHLKRKRFATPELLRTKDGALFVQEERVWRVMTYLPSSSYERVTSPAIAAAAGELVARFHAALADLRHTFKFTRAGVHDTAKHFATLRAAIGPHRYRDQIMPIADEILAAELPAIDLSKKRIAHGDLKITNLLFDSAGKGLALIDLDTLGMMPLAHEMGDAWRSWCNPGGEDDVNARFDLSLFEASARAYRLEMTPEERASLVGGIATIALELAARFCADAFNEKYFGWNEKKFPDRSTHNLVRATSQLRLYQSVMAQRAAAEACLRLSADVSRSGR